MTHTYTFPDLRPPGEGPWNAEPDKVQWIDDVTDLDCLIVRSRLGTLCGYVGVPPGHPWHGRRCDTIPAHVHGGLVYSAYCQESSEKGVCHVPGPGRPAAVWWLGFDCCHADDLIPTFAAMGGTYRDIEYVRTWVAVLAAQVDAAR